MILNRIVFTLTLSIQVPAITRWEDELVKQTLEYNLTAATVRLFEERPIWAKLTLLDRLADLGVVITDAHVKRCASLAHFSKLTPPPPPPEGVLAVLE